MKYLETPTDGDVPVVKGIRIPVDKILSRWLSPEPLLNIYLDYRCSWAVIDGALRERIVQLLTH